MTRYSQDIAEQGQQEPILLHQGKVIDGRHRLRACRELGIEPVYKEVTYPEDRLPALILSLNLYRRHLTAAQKAMIAALVSRESKQGRRSIEKVQNCTFFNGNAMTQATAAKAVGVSVRHAKTAARVLKQDERLASQVLRGECTLESAALQASLSRTMTEGGNTKAARELIEKEREKAEIGPDHVRWNGYAASLRATTMKLLNCCTSLRPLLPSIGQWHRIHARWRMSELPGRR